MTRKVFNEDEEEFHLDPYKKALLIINCVFIALAFISLEVAGRFGDIGYLLLFLCLTLYVAIGAAYGEIMDKRNHNNNED